MCAKNDTPRRNSGLTLYRHLAGTDDLATAWLEPYRHRAVSELRLQTGDVVLDVGCGTGMSFPPIQAAIGPEGRLVDIEPSPEMLARARASVQTAAWTNVTLLKASVEEAGVRLRRMRCCSPSPAMWCGDAKRWPTCSDRCVLVDVAATGPKWALLAPPLNVMVWQVARQFVTTFEGFARPRSELQRVVPQLSVEEAFLGCVYVAWGQLPG